MENLGKTSGSKPPAKSDIATTADDLQVLLFRLGGRSFGVPLDHVRYVSKMPIDFSGSGSETEDHFVFEGSPLPYVSLWDRLGLNSEYAEYEEMQSMLPARKQDHLDWMDALEYSIRNGTAFAKARSPHECAFGKWYYGYRAKDRRLALLLGQFEVPHATIHGLADKLLGMSEAGQTGEAVQAFEEAKHTTLAKLMQLFASAQDLVVELQRRIAVIVAAGDDTCALGADGVREIISVPPEHIKQNAGKGLGVQSNVASTLIIIDDRTVVPLLDWRTFCGGAMAAA